MNTRITRLQARMKTTGTDLLALAPGAHMRWLLGFTPHPDERLCVLLVSADKATFVMPALNATDARQHTDLPFHEWADAEGPAQALAAALAVVGTKPRKLSLDETMRADHALMLLDALPKAERGLAGEEVGALRQIKDADEIIALRDNALIADKAQAAVRAALRPGVTEAEMVQVARDAFAAEGARCEFGIVGFGENSAYPHHHSGSRKLKAGDVVLEGGIHVRVGCRLEFDLAIHGRDQRAIQHAPPSQGVGSSSMSKDRTVRRHCVTRLRSEEWRSSETATQKVPREERVCECRIEPQPVMPDGHYN